jgi:GNAT superfamily N-acetyltransferase
MFGNVPYSEAWRGDEAINEPKFDDSKTEVYPLLIAKLDEALAKDFTLESNTDVGTADFVFAGDIDEWIRFANTLKLKIYLRYAEVEPGTAQAGIEALYDAGAEFLTTDAAIDQFVDQASKSNPFYEMDKRQLNTTQNLKASKTLFNLLDQNDDPRLVEIYNEAEAGGYLAMNQGDFNATSTALPPLTISTAKVDATDPVYFISAAESYFLQAEAVERGWGTGDANALYDLGVAASFAQMGFEGDEADLIDGGAYDYDVFFGGGLGAILMQKWIALAGTYQGIEGFFDRMRTGFPELSPVYHADASYEPGLVVYPKEGTLGNNFARRAFLPDIETSRNPNAPDQADLTDPMWWHID